MGTIMKLIAKMFTIAGMAAALVSCADKAAENKEFKFLITKLDWTSVNHNAVCGLVYQNTAHFQNLRRIILQCSS